jgi:apolipoprotein N-acyltransferase
MLEVWVADRGIAAGAGLEPSTCSCLLWLPITRRLTARAHARWATTTYLFVVYLAFMPWWTSASHLGIAGDAGGILLRLLELVAAVLGCAHLWELCDTLGRASWRRRIGTRGSRD